MADTSGLPPEGWYPDRPNATRLRHWSGTGWTNEFRPIEAEPAVAPAPVAPAPVALAPVSPVPVSENTDRARSRRELRAQVGALVQGEPDTPAGGVTTLTPPTPMSAQGAPAQPAPAPAPVVEIAEPVVVAEIEPEPEPEPVAIPDSEPDSGPKLSSADRARVAGGYAPHRQAWQESFSAPDLPTGTSQTFAGWLFATSPLWVGAMIIAGTTVLSVVDPYLVQAGLLVVAFAMTFLLARQDVRLLTERGYRTPSVWWVLLPFAYFFVRLLRVGLRGMGMLVTYFLSAVALVGLLYLAFVGNPALFSTFGPSVQAESTPIPTPVATLSDQERANLLTPDGIEAKLRIDLASTWDVGTVDCVPFPSTDPGTTTTCVVVLDNVSYNAGLQVTPDEPDVAFVLTGMLPVP